MISPMHFPDVVQKRLKGVAAIGDPKLVFDELVVAPKRAVCLLDFVCTVAVDKKPSRESMKLSDSSN
jgi:hypothetical protein